MQLCKLSLPHHTKVLQLCVAISSAGSRPRDKRGGGRGVHPDPQMTGGGGGLGSPKKIFSALRTSVWSKSKEEGGGPPPPPLPRSATVIIFGLWTLDFGVITFKLGNFPNFKVHFATLLIDNRLLVFICARVYYFDTFQTLLKLGLFLVTKTFTFKVQNLSCENEIYSHKNQTNNFDINSFALSLGLGQIGSGGFTRKITIYGTSMFFL